MFGASTLGQVVLGGVQGGGITQSTDLDFIVVDRKTITSALDFIVLVTTTKTFVMDFIVAGSGIKFTALDFIIAEPIRSNQPTYESIGNNLSQAIEFGGLATWSTNNRPLIPKPYMAGVNTSTGKVEYYDPNSSSWKNYDGTSV